MVYLNRLNERTASKRIERKSWPAAESAETIFYSDKCFRLKYNQRVKRV